MIFEVEIMSKSIVQSNLY